MESADVAQEVLLEIARAVARERFASEAAFLRWATVVVEHRILRLAKRWRAARRKIEREAYLLDGRLAVDPKAERPSKILERGEALERLSRALAELPAAEREVVVARVLLDLPWAQVAASLGITVAAGQMRLLRARRYLSTLLG
jgi:RNA polymerase sigma factor (sigma-70 family)